MCLWLLLLQLQVSESRCFVSLATTSSLFVYSIVDPPYDNLNPYLRLVQRVESPHNLPITDPTFAPQQYEKSGIHDVPLVPRVLTVSADTTVKVHKIKAVTNWLCMLFVLCCLIFVILFVMRLPNYDMRNAGSQWYEKIGIHEVPLVLGKFAKSRKYPTLFVVCCLLVIRFFVEIAIHSVYLRHVDYIRNAEWIGQISRALIMLLITGSADTTVNVHKTKEVNIGYVCSCRTSGVFCASVWAPDSFFVGVFLWETVPTRKSFRACPLQNLLSVLGE